jgi:hypothetical protein
VFGYYIILQHCSFSSDPLTLRLRELARRLIVEHVDDPRAGQMG